ncbi:hypothetical protein VKT23_017869 [Stygiomarasmius scandens]|uniref:Telomere replication protein EST3 n=1 Tax=Marasmiellus scandens TaxID=2682957 RepID=A0ABR1IQS0_9AGAR
MTKGPTKHDVRAVAKIISDGYAKQATLNRGIWVYAFVVDPTGHHSMISGWGKEYENMKVAFPSQITSQLHDVGILLGGEHIKVQIGSAVSAELKSLVLTAAEVGNDRDCERGLVPKILLYDIGSLGIKHPARFPWKNFSNYAYKHQIRIMNWPEDLAAPGAGLKDVNQAVSKTGGPSSLTATRIEELLWLRDAWARKDANPTPPEHITSKALRVVSWSDEEKNLSPEKQKDVALVKCSDGRTLTSVLNSKQWRKQQNLPADESDAENPKNTSPSPSSPGRSLSRSPSCPPEFFEEGRPPFAFSDEEEQQQLRMHPEPTPFSSPVRRAEPSRLHSDRLFIGAETQQQFLQSSDGEMGPEDEYEDSAHLKPFRRSQPPNQRRRPHVHVNPRDANDYEVDYEDNYQNRRPLVLADSRSGKPFLDTSSGNTQNRPVLKNYGAVQQRSQTHQYRSQRPEFSEYRGVLNNRQVYNGVMRNGNRHEDLRPSTHPQIRGDKRAEGSEDT